MGNYSDDDDFGDVYLYKRLSDICIKEMDSWVNSGEMVGSMIIDGGSIDLITDLSKIKIDDYITKEGK